jgi:hypothetical protein
VEGKGHPGGGAAPPRRGDLGLGGVVATSFSPESLLASLDVAFIICFEPFRIDNIILFLQTYQIIQEGSSCEDNS